MLRNDFFVALAFERKQVVHYYVCKEMRKNNRQQLKHRKELSEEISKVQIVKM